MSTATNRPLSPHLQVYKPQLTSVLSIAHRASGIWLSLGGWLLVVMLYGLVFDAAVYDAMVFSARVLWGQILVFTWVLAFYWHLFSGLRHLWWDTGRGLSLGNVYASGYAVIAAALLATGLTYGYVFL